MYSLMRYVPHVVHSMRLGIGAIVTIAARSLDVDAAYLLNGNPEHLRNGLLIRIDALGVGPDRREGEDFLPDKKLLQV